MNIDEERYDDGYYHLKKDLEEYPDAWCYVVWSRRGPGKTYSALRYFYYTNTKILYIKRTNLDVDLICGAKNGIYVDASPYKPINRDFGTNIRGIKMGLPGFGAFFNTIDTEDGKFETVGPEVAYCVSLNAIKSLKGIDLSDCDAIVFDEFIPQQGERTNTKEGSMLLDLYMTIARDREARGRPPLKLILFANAENIATPITNEFEITDEMQQLTASGNTHLLMEERAIMLHRITEEEIPLNFDTESGIYKGMKGTNWHAKSFGAEFAGNDFSSVKNVSLKGYRPFIFIQYKRYQWIIWQNPNNGNYHCCKSFGKAVFTYDLNRQSEQKRFHMEQWIQLRSAFADGRMTFQTYTMLDVLLINFKKYFDIL